MEILKNYIKAINTHNFNEVRKLLHPNATFFFTDQTCTTYEEIKSYFESTWTLVQNEYYEARDVKWLFTGSHSATCTYTYFYEGYINGKYTSGYGRATNVFVKEFDNWLLIHEHLSPSPNLIFH